MANDGDVTSPVRLIDDRLHGERIARPRATWQASLADLPDGTIWLQVGKPWVVAGRRVARWTPHGYRDHDVRPSKKTVPVLTPPSIVAALAAGYRVILHSTAL